MPHSALLPTQQHALATLSVLPGNPNLVIHSVMLHNVSRDDALKITAMVDRQGLSPLVWEPSLVQTTEVAKPDPGPVEPTPEQTT